MITKITKISEIELTVEELSTIAKTRDILKQIVDFAVDEEIAGFTVAQGYDDYNFDEFSDCVTMLNCLCHPCAKLAGYFDEE